MIKNKPNSTNMRNMLVFLITLLSLQVVAQRREVLKLPFNHENREKLTNSLQYIEPDFVMGGISLKDGAYIRTLMNFNILYDEVHFVVKDAETGEDQIRVLTNTADLNFVTVGSRTFLHFQNLGFFEVLVSGDIKLVKRTTLDLLADDKPRDGYGNLPEASSTTKIGYFDLHEFDMLNPPDREKLIAAKTVKTEKYYVLRGNTPRVINSKRAMIRLMPKSKRDDLSGFVDQFGGSWNEESNLIQAFKFLNK
jgi:hypothetical protein